MEDTDEMGPYWAELDAWHDAWAATAEEGGGEWVDWNPIET